MVRVNVDIRTGAGRALDADAELPAGFSQLVGKVLDLLSLSSWLPATMLVGSGAVLFQLHSQRNLDVGTALVNLARRPLDFPAVMAFALVLTATVTQAFEFEMLRALEGYWGTVLPMRGLANLRSERHRKRKRRLQEEYAKYERQAFRAARKRMLEAHFDRELIEIVKCLVRRKPTDCYHKDLVQKARKIPWQRYSPPEYLRRMQVIDSRINSYPQPHRVLPTRLGNILRATEDELARKHRGEFDELVLQRYDLIPGVLRDQHDRYRARLDMYCMLVFVFAFLALLGPVLVIRWPAHIPGAALIFSFYSVLAMVSYQAAVASARGYCTVLRAIDTRLAPPRPAKTFKPSTSTSSR